MSPGIWLSQFVVLLLLVMILSYTQCWHNNRCVCVNTLVLNVIPEKIEQDLNCCQ